MYRMLVLVVALGLGLLVAFQFSGKEQKVAPQTLVALDTVQPTAVMVTLNGRITDASTGAPLPARVVLRDAAGNVINSYYAALPGFFTETNGAFAVSLLTGEYTYEVTHGIDYVRAVGKLKVDDNRATLDVALKPLVPLRELGWVNGEAHAHIVSSTSNNAPMIDLAHRIARAQGLDFLVAVQNWGGYNESTWAAAEAIGSDDQFGMYYGAEVPKQRFGHTWWIGLNNTCGYYDYGMDAGYSTYYRSTDTQFSAAGYPLVQMPSMEVVPRLRKSKDAIAVHAHPTSWWWQGIGQDQFITNISADLVPDLLSGQLWDGMVVMGYDRDHYFYQNLWFWVLNKGYRMTPFAELDGGLPANDPRYYGAMRTYFHLDGPFSIPAVVQAARAGHTFITSGPILLANVDEKYQVGDIVPLDGSKHRLNIEAYGSGELDDYITYVIVFRNGKVYKVWDSRTEKPHHVSYHLDIQEYDKSWFVVKTYGSRSIDDPALLDVMALSKKAETDVNAFSSKSGSADVAITSPFYFWPPNTEAPAALMSHVDLKLVDTRGGPISEATVRLLLLGEAIGDYPIVNGAASFDMPVNTWLEISTPDGKVIHRSLFTDYEPYNKLLYPLISGQWITTHGLKETMKPGRVPTWAFAFDEIKKALTNVSWSISMVENVRDVEWSRLETLDCPP